MYKIPDNPIKLWIDRKNKHLWISCKKTKFSKVMIRWNYLFDEGKELEEDKATEQLPDTDFIKRMNDDFAKHLYNKLQRQEGNLNPSGAAR